MTGVQTCALPISRSATFPLCHQPAHNLTTDTLYRELVQTVNAFALVSPSTELETFAADVNALISQYKLVIANQGKSKKEE